MFYKKVITIWLSDVSLYCIFVTDVTDCSVQGDFRPQVQSKKHSSFCLNSCGVVDVYFCRFGCSLA